MTTDYDITPKTTHDLWVESRQFRIDISRPTPTTIELWVTRPAGLMVTDGAIIVLSEQQFTANNYPSEGETYVGSLDWANPGSDLFGAKVVAAYYGILNQPFPPNENLINPEEELTFKLTVTNTDPNTLYFASVHGCTNVLQYYPIGVQSYPLPEPDFDKGLTSYTGNIPSFPSAPTSPNVGMVYHDQQLNLIQYWTGSTWIPSRADTIISGPYNPGVTGQVYFNSPSYLKAFTGTAWVTVDSTNMQVKTGPTTWAPFTFVQGDMKAPEAPAVGDFFWDYSQQRLQFWDGVNWVFPTPSNTLFNNGAGWVQAFVTPVAVESQELKAPYIGQLFYNTSVKVLNAWTGPSTGWQQVNTDQEGAPSFDKVNIGNNGSYEGRLRLMNVLKSQLGWPQMCVELQEEQLGIAIDNALDNYRQHSDGAYTTAYVVMSLMENQQTYYLNSPIDKTDHIVNVHKAHRMNVLGAGLGSDNIFMQAFLTEYYYSSGSADILSTHLLAGLSEDLERIFAGNLTFVWNEATRELTFTRKISRNEKVILECQMERAEQEIMIDRWCKQYIQNWALAECKMMLGMVRSKFSSGTPGPNGSINLNGELLIAEARQDMQDLKQALLDYEYGGHVGHGNVSFLIG